MKLEKKMFLHFIYGYLNFTYLGDDSRKKKGIKKSRKECRAEMIEDMVVVRGMSRNVAHLLCKIAIPHEVSISCAILFGKMLTYPVKWLLTSKTSIKNSYVTIKQSMTEKRIRDIFTSAGFKDVTFVDVPCNPGKYSSNSKVVSVFSGITFAQLITSISLSFKMACFINKRYGKNDCLFRSYSALDYFMAYYYFQNLDKSNEVVFVDTFYKWAYIYCNSPLKKTFVQHGIIHKYPYMIKVGEVDKAFYINSVQREVCEYTLFKNKPEVHYRKVFDYTSNEKLKHNGKKNILIISECTFFERMVEIIKSIYEKNVNIYLKPHPIDPLDKYVAIKSELPDITILERYDYPQVDAAISYDSTLADEYELHEIPVVRIEDEKIDEEIRNICT